VNAVSTSAAICVLRRQRALLVSTLVLGGDGTTLRLQVVATGRGTGTTSGPYRAPTDRGFGPAARPRPPHDGLTLFGPAAAICGGALTLWAWHFANPVVVLDNASERPATVQIDDGEALLVSGHARESVRLPAGAHSVRVQRFVGREERIDVEVRAGSNFLFAVAPACYDVSAHAASRPHQRPSVALDRAGQTTTSGRWIAIGEPEDAVSTNCAVPFSGFSR
jgi:hypothetical protein